MRDLLYSWRIRLWGASFDLEDEELVDDLLRMGWCKKRLGHYCLTREGHRCLEEGMRMMTARRFEEAERYERALEQISAAYPGQREYPGLLARRALRRY